MPFPRFLSPRVQVPLAPRAAGGAAPKKKKLNLSLSSQLQTNWCWAAVATGVSHFYSPTSGWSQGAVADAALARTDCCAVGAADPLKCNKPWYLDSALIVTGNLDRMETRSLTLGEIQAAIQQDSPIGTRVGWFGGGGHFQTIVGWLVADSGIEYIDISDPIYLDSQIVFSEFASAYQGGGTWTHSYLTAQPAPLVAVAMLAGADSRFEPLDRNAIGG